MLINERNERLFQRDRMAIRLYVYLCVSPLNYSHKEYGYFNVTMFFNLYSVLNIGHLITARLQGMYVCV